MKKQIINYQEKWKEYKIKVNDLVLDTKNVRLGTEYNSQDEIINDLFVNENAMDILENILQNGYFPDEPPVVIKEKNQFIVLEGNRRVVSLKAMISPAITPSKYETRIKKLMEGYSPIETIIVHVATSRDEAMEYLASKHTKTTRRPWSALRRAYFYYAQKEQGQSVEKLIERYKGVDIPGYIKMHEMHNVAMSLKNISEDVRKKVSNKGTFNISTLERFYLDKYVQEKIGIDFNKTTGEATVPSTPDFDKVYSRVVTDIATGIATSRKELSKEPNRKSYIDSVVREVLEGKELNKKMKKSASTFKESKVSSKKQRGLISKKIDNPLDSPGVGRVLWELQNMDYVKYPNASADLLRTFLEIVLKKYLEDTNGLPTPTDKNGKKKFVMLSHVLLKIKSDLQKTSNTKMVQVVQEIEKNKWYLDSINHNPDVFAVGDRVKDAWDQIYPLIKFVFEEYKKNVLSKQK